MPDSYDIFRQNEDGDPVWVEAVEGLNQVKKRLLSLSSVKPGKYLVYHFAKAELVEPFKKSA